MDESKRYLVNFVGLIFATVTFIVGIVMITLDYVIFVLIGSFVSVFSVIYSTFMAGVMYWLMMGFYTRLIRSERGSRD